MSYNKYLDIIINPENFQEDVKKLLVFIRPNWCLETIKVTKQTGGVSNLLFAVSSGRKEDMEDVVLVRVAGEMLIDRNLELDNMSALSCHGLAASVCGQFMNGCSYQYIHGSLMEMDDLYDEYYMDLTIKEFAKLHTVKLDLARPKSPFIFPKIRDFANNLPVCLDDPQRNKIYQAEFPPKTEFRTEMETLQEAVKALNCPVNFCHNDLLVRNMIVNQKKNRIHFIDFEYADYNYAAFDIGNHFNEFAGLDTPDYSNFPTKEYQLRWIRQYLELRRQFEHQQQSHDNGNHYNDVAIDDAVVYDWYRMANVLSLASHLLWSAWSIWQERNAAIEFNYLEYAVIRWNEFKRRKSYVLSL